MIWWYSLSVVVIFLDQLSKKYMTSILALCEPGFCESIVILPVFKFTLLHNRGAAFSFLNDQDGWQRWFLLLVSAVISLVLVVWMSRLEKNQTILKLALALILGGALGNMLDRAFLGYVIDFIVVHYENHYFPAFNLADSAITLGAGFLILDMFYHPENRPKD
ncbi:MAG: signal peptidase II [Gammaproteobacteria bacterium]|nr:signal peptidase II [Gammaproteobacteria bacterium]